MNIAVNKGILDLLCVEESQDIDGLYVLPWETHVGAEEFDEATFLNWVEWVRTSDSRGRPARVILVGDTFEFATKDSIGDVFTQKMPPEEQMKWAADRLSTIADKIYGILDGNHEWRVTKNTSIQPGWWLADKLGVPYFSGGQGVIKVRLGKGHNGKPVCYILHVAHGSSNARTSGGKLGAAHRMIDVVANADVYVSGHSHGHTADRVDRIVVDPQNNTVRSEKLYVVLAGSFLSYAGYAKRAVMSPLGTGCPRIRLDGKRKDVHVSV